METVQEAGVFFLNLFNAIIGFWNSILDFLGIPVEITPLEW